MVELEKIKECKSYADAIRLIFNKNYTNGRIIKEVKQGCFDVYGFDLEKHINDYNSRKVYCLNCGKEIIGEDRFQKKFCDRSCAATYNNRKRGVRTKEEKKKISESLLKYNAERKGLSVKEYLVIPRTKSCCHLKYRCVCKICGNEFGSAHANSTHCSPKCIAADLNVKQKLHNKAYERIKNGTFSGGKCRNITSYPEEFGINVLKSNNISFIREDFSTKKYFLDFLIEKNGKKVDLEIDGKQHKYENRKQHDLERDRYLTELGFIIYRIDGNSINTKNGRELMKIKIDTFLNGYKNL